ncbi:thiamine biosynthesis lipoprotein [Ruminiclostridium sufflavum DSM 19573]|uniref:FAD:protein FMN transferase n=1 Tax=Ruminiclostridium sufflavum DSM 19573 TaxID=1121337 RepID=A0A318Y6M2_9FIRM|nr:FAD:protein FMN transferase [Ruminiclostridium sufflavum]PYG87747.1 thiamine biosynthesis lipoprotein [Ruminiclostridium sufflavum DSM 19573]
MFKKLTATIIAITFLINLTACGSQDRKRYEAEFLELFDTMTKIVAYTDSKEEFTRYSRLIYDNLKEYHQLYDIYNNYDGINNIKTINDNAGIKAVKVDKRIIALINYSIEWYKKTNGKMNIALGSVLEIWHKYREEGIDNEAEAAVPDMAELKKAAEHTDINKIIIDEANSTVFLADPEMSIDVGSIGKGYATEQVSRIAYEKGFTSGLISVGGNIRAIGNKDSGGKLWNLGIQNPDKESEKSNVSIVYLADLSLVSSGDYERYYTVNGKRYHHLIDPDTLFPAEYFSQVTIVCKNSGMADALSTAVFCMPVEKGMEFINNLPDTEALWVMKNGDLKYSKGFEEFTKD